MRAYIILCLASLSAAAPQGYNYAAQQQHGGSGISASTFLKDLHAVMAVQSSGLDASTAVNFGATYPSVADIAEQYVPQQIAQPQPRYLPPNTYANANYDAAPAHYEQQPIVSKRFFIHSAPEEEEDEVQHRSLTIGQARKNYNVVFIKAPAKAAQKTSIKISPAVNEEKTVIYVLAKKAEEAQIDAHVHEPATTTAKPEVFFIKYKTNEEAEHAQRTIQSQYDSIGGSTVISNEGIAPVSSVIGALDAGRQVSGYGSAEAVSADLGAGVNNSYLPPAKYKH